MNKILVIGLITVLAACSNNGPSSTVTETKPEAQIDCTKLDANAADYPAACKNEGVTNPPPPPAPCKNDPCEGDEQPAQ